MKTHLFVATLFLNISLFGQQHKTSSNEVFVKIKDNFEVDLAAYSDAKSVKSQSKNGVIESLFFKLFDKYEIKSSKKGSKLKSSKLQLIYKISIKDSTRLNAFLTEIKQNNVVEYAEKIPIYELFYTPNDLHPNQWHLPKINAVQAWDLSVGNGNVVIAIVDDAVRLDHQDIAPNVWVNPNEIAGNGIDDDANGYIDDINGYDVADGDNNPTTTNSGKKHGTHCAGIAAAKSNNGVGIASISSNCKIMAVKCTRDAVTSPSIPFAYDGLEYAIVAKPDVISLSWGGFFYSQTYQLLFDYAYSQGIIVVAAAGNNATDAPFYPASYNHVISVGATDTNDKITNFSNYGSTIDVMAPGLDIWSSVSSSNASYENLSGTSMSCPLVAGLCGLMKSYMPSATNTFIEGCLTSSAINIDALNFGYENQMGFGRIDAFLALSCMDGKPVVDFNSDKTTPCVSQQVSFFDKSIGNGITTYGWTFTGANITTSTLKDPVVSYSSPGIYSVTHAATNSKGTSTITKTSYITITSPSAAISGTATITQGQQTFLKINFIGTAPFNFNINNGVSNTNYSNIYANPHYIFVAPNTTTTYTLNTFSDASCAGNTSGSALITVNTVAGVPTTVIGTNCAPTNGLVAYYPFDGNANDASGNGNNGILNGCTFVPDRNGNVNAAIKFNGTSDFIRVPNSTSLNPTTEMTFSVWIKPEGYFNSTFYSRYNQIFTSGYGNDATYQVRYNSNTNHGGTIPKFEFAQKYNDASASGLVSLQIANLNNIYHLVCVFNGNQQLIYINGILDNSIAIGSNKTAAISLYTNFYIGKNNDINYPYFVNGIMDELRIYNRALDDCEIKQLYDCNSTCSSSLIASYPFCGNANDVSGNNNNGTVSGATLTNDRFGNANSAYKFDGNEFIRIKRTIQDNFSISFWYKSTMIGSNCGSNSNQWHCGFGIIDADKSGCQSDFGVSINNGKIAYGTGSSNCINDIFLQTNSLFNDNNWHHVVAVRNLTGNLELYTDNLRLFSQPSTNFESLNAQSRITFGGIENGSIGSESVFRNFIGILDDIKIYNKALSQSEITALYNEPAPCETGGLIASYPFCGNANDVSGNNNNGTVLGATLTNDRFGNANSAYSFDGTNGCYINTNFKGILGRNARSVSAWVKLASAKEMYAFGWGSRGVAYGNCYAGGFSYSSPLSIITEGNDVVKGYGNTNLNTWHHIVWVAESNITFDQTKIYYDGVLLSSVSENYISSRILNTIEDITLKIGANPLIGSNLNFQGSIDDIKIYNKVLTQSEITALYNEPAYCPTQICNPVSITGNSSFCKGVSTSNQTYSVNAIQGATYFWSISGLGIIGTGSTININWQDVGNFTLQVISSNLCQGSASKVISVNCCSNPSTAKAEFFLTSDAVCGKAYIPIFNNSIGNSFSWDFGKDASITNFNGKNPPSIFYKKAGLKNIKLVVQNLCGVKDSLVKQVFVQPQPFAYAGKDIVSCSIDAQELGSSEIGLFQYQWSPITAVDNPNIAKPSLIKTFTGQIILKVSQFDETFDCPAYDTLNVVRLDSSFSTILPREVTSICEDVVLNVVSSRSTNRYLWNTGSTISGIKVSESGVYFVKTYNACVEKTDSVLVKINRPIEKIPNVITPNSDKFNDVLEFYGCYFEQNPFSIQVYNRYGVKVYESDNYKNDWSAEGLPDGIYYFSTESLISKVVKKGWIQILR